MFGRSSPAVHSLPDQNPNKTQCLTLLRMYETTTLIARPSYLGMRTGAYGISWGFKQLHRYPKMSRFTDVFKKSDGPRMMPHHRGVPSRREMSGIDKGSR